MRHPVEILIWYWFSVVGTNDEYPSNPVLSWNSGCGTAHIILTFNVILDNMHQVCLMLRYALIIPSDSTICRFGIEAGMLCWLWGLSCVISKGYVVGMAGGRDNMANPHHLCRFSIFTWHRKDNNIFLKQIYGINLSN